MTLFYHQFGAEWAIDELAPSDFVIFKMKSVEDRPAGLTVSREPISPHFETKNEALRHLRKISVSAYHPDIDSLMDPES